MSFSRSCLRAHLGCPLLEYVGVTLSILAFLLHLLELEVSFALFLSHDFIPLSARLFGVRGHAADDLGDFLRTLFNLLVFALLRPAADEGTCACGAERRGHRPRAGRIEAPLSYARTPSGSRLGRRLCGLRFE